MATNITYVLSLDSSGAVSSVNKVTKSFSELDTVQQQFAKNAGKIAPKELDKYINALKKIKEILGTMKPSFDLGKMVAQTTSQITKASNLLEQRLQQIQAKQVAQMQSSFGLFTRIEATLASRTPAQRKADTQSTQSDYKNKIEAENKALKEQARISAETSIKRKKDEQELANFLLKQEEDLLAKMRSRWNIFANEQKQFEQAELARVAKLATDELKVKEQALSSFTKAMQANSNQMVQLFKQEQQAIKETETINKMLLAQKDRLIKLETQETLAVEKTTQAEKAREATIANLLIRLTNLKNKQSEIAKEAATQTGFGKFVQTEVSLKARTPAQLNADTGYAKWQADQAAKLAQATKLAEQATLALAQALDVAKTAASNSWQSFKNLIEAATQTRIGMSKLQQENLAMVDNIKAEIDQRNRLKAELASVNPLLQTAATLRTKEYGIIKDTKQAYVEYTTKLHEATSTTEVQKLTTAWQSYLATQKAALAAVVAQGDVAVKSYERQQAALQRLQQSALRGVGIKATAWQHSGTLGQLSASGTSPDAIKGQQIRFQLEDIDKRYSKLVERFKREVLQPNMDASKIANATQKYDYLAGKLGKIRTTAQQALGEIEKLTKGVHQLDQVHKPFLERIFDLVVGYKLINAAVNTFTNAMRSVPEAGLQFETTYATLKATFSVTTKVNEQLSFLDKLAQEAGISIDALRTSFVEFAASAKFSGESVGNIPTILALASLSLANLSS